MAQVLVRGLDKTVVEKLKKRAAQEGRSLQAQLKTILEAQARPQRAQVCQKSATNDRIQR